VEVAVAATHGAEGHVHVDAERAVTEPAERRGGQHAGGWGGFAVREGAGHGGQSLSRRPVGERSLRVSGGVSAATRRRALNPGRVGPDKPLRAGSRRPRNDPTPPV